MGRIPGLRRLFRLPATEERLARDVEEELAFHVETRVAELEAGGLSPAAARAQALREFGDVAGARSELVEIDRRRYRRERRAGALDALAQDVRHALRGLRRQPGFALAVVLTLGLGVGVNAAMFGITDRLLLQPPAHVADPDRVVRVFFTQTFSWAGLVTQATSTYPDYLAFREEVPAFAAVGAYFSSETSLGRGEDARAVRRGLATWGLFAALGTRPALGRFFSEAEDRPPAGAGVAVLGHEFWRRRFGADPSVLGERLRIGRGTYTVIGVAPRGFNGVEFEPVDVWVPMSAAGAEIIGDVWHATRDARWIRVVARLRPEADVATAARQATMVHARHNPERFGADSTARVTLGPVIAARGPVIGAGTEHRSARISLWLSGVSLLVLVIACANVANLLLARAMRRRREVAIRVALGVRRGRLVGQVLVETLLLALLGGAVGLVLAYWGGSAARALLLPDVSWPDGPFDGRAVAFAAALVVGSGLIAALAPALHALGGHAGGALRAGTRGGGAHDRSRVRAALVALQAAVSVVLLAGAGLFVRSLHNVRHLPLGFDPDRVMVVRWDAGAMDERSPARLDQLYRQARERVASLPVVDAAGIGTSIPFLSTASAPLAVPGLDSLPEVRDGGPYYSAVTPEFFRTMGTRIVRGRGFTEQDREGSERVAVVGETMARLLWPGEDALGRCIQVTGRNAPCSTVVGVAEDAARQGLDSGPVMQYYLPLDQRQTGIGMRALFVRAAGDPAAAIAAVRGEVQALDPDLPYANVRLLGDTIDPLRRPWRLGAILFSIFGALALLLVAIGLYGVIAYAVSQRTHEMGVRIALGARGWQVARLVLADVTRIVLAGGAAGMAIALLAADRVAPLLFRVEPRDPLVLAAVAALLLVTAIAAALVPARRAVRVDPASVLREE